MIFSVFGDFETCSLINGSGGDTVSNRKKPGEPLLTTVYTAVAALTSCTPLAWVVVYPGNGYGDVVVIRVHCDHPPGNGHHCTTTGLHRHHCTHYWATPGITVSPPGHLKIMKI